MAESSSHNPSSPEITPKEKPVTLDKPESLNPFLLADQIEFSFDKISFTTNNEVALLYHSHSNSEYFEIVSDFLSKCCLKEAFTRAPTQYKEYLCEIRGDIEYMMPKYENEDLTINPTRVFSVHNWELKPNQHEGPPFTDHMKAICNLDVPVDSKALKPSSQTEEVPQGKKPRAKSGLIKKQSSKHTAESNTEASESKTGQSDKETQSSLAKDKSPSHPSPPTLVDGEMHKEAQQAAGGPTSLGATRHDASADSTTEADPGLSTPNDSISSQQGMDEGTKNYSIDHIFELADLSVLVDQTKSIGDGLKTAHSDSGTNEESIADEISKKIKLEDLSDLLKDTRSAFFTPDSPQDEPIIVSDESEAKENKKEEDTHATSHDIPDDTSVPHPTSLKLAQIQELMAQLKKHAQDREIELHGDIKEILTKLETFTSTISSLSSQVDELKNIQWELPAKFAIIVENASGAARNNVPSAGQASALPTEGEKNTTKDAETNLQN
ncbi:hypothetical protein Tco_1186476 [Tanacetum coccineum]